MKLLAVRKENMALRRYEVNTFKGMDSRVIGRKLEGSFVLPFLCISTEHAFFHSAGTDFEDQTLRITSVKYVRRNGHRLKQIIES
jgi:hypothetical protein